MDPDLPLFDLITEPILRDPVLIISLEGWVDAGLGASAAMSSLLGSSPTDLVATFDADELLDQRARRPIARIVDGVTTELRWPEIELRSGVDSQGRDILYLTGPEPDVQWRSFTDAVYDLCLRFDVTTVVGLGAFPAPAPHTRPGPPGHPRQAGRRPPPSPPPRSRPPLPPPPPLPPEPARRAPRCRSAQPGSPGGRAREWWGG